MSSLEPLPSLPAVGPVNEASALDPTSRVIEHLPALPLNAKESTRKHLYETMSQPTRKVIIMGATGAGKSTFINSAAGSCLEVSNSLVSCTRTLGVAPLVLEDGTRIELVDTPGFDDSVRSDLEILEEISMGIKGWSDIYGIIYLHRISDFRISGAARKTFDACFHICGEPAMPWLTIATNMWDKVSPELGAAREDELRHKPEFFETVIKSGARLLRNDSPPTSARNIIQMAIRERPVSLQIQTQLCENDDNILATTAGKMLDQELAEKRAKHEAELAKISEEYGRALQQQDEETQAELEEEREIIRKKISEMQAITKRIKANQKPKSDRVHKPPRPTAPYSQPVHPPQRVDPPGFINTAGTMSCYGASERTNWMSGPATYDEARAVTTSTRLNDGDRIRDRAGNRRPSRARSDGEIARDISMVKQQVMAMSSGTYAQSITPQTQDIDRRYIARSSSRAYNPPYATGPSARGGYSTGREPLQHHTVVERMPTLRELKLVLPSTKRLREHHVDTLFGATGTGKTTFVNDASGADLQVGHKLAACTKVVTPTHMFQLDRRSVCLINTPGFNDTELSDGEVLKRISAFLSSAYENGHKLTGIIYLHRIKDERMTGIDVRNFKMFRKLCGADSLCNVVLVTNMWADPPTEDQLSRETELRDDYFKQAIDQGATLVRRPRKGTASAHEIIRMVLQKNPIVMQIQHELVDEKQNVSDTGAGQVLGADLAKVKTRYEKEMAEIREELRVALEEKDTQTELEMKEALRQATANSQRVAQEIEALRLGVDEERARWERRIDESNRDRREAEKQQAELRAQMEELRRLAESARETDKAWYEEQIRGLRDKIQELTSKTASNCVVM